VTLGSPFNQNDSTSIPWEPNVLVHVGMDVAAKARAVRHRARAVIGLAFELSALRARWQPYCAHGIGFSVDDV
jgi:hypothetical protein